MTSESSTLQVFSQSQRDCILQPRVARLASPARTELPWECPSEHSNPNGDAAPGPAHGCNPVGVEDKIHTLSQGSSVRAGLANLATLGFTTESRWDSAAGLANLVGKAKAASPQSKT